MADAPNRYSALIEKIFFDRFADGARQLEFERVDIESAASDLGIKLPKNLGRCALFISVQDAFAKPHSCHPTGKYGMADNYGGKRKIPLHAVQLKQGDTQQGVDADRRARLHAGNHPQLRAR